MEQAAEYERAASSAAGALRQSLEDLYRAKQAEIAALAPLARDLGVTAAAPPPPSGPDRPWGVVLGEAFQAERTLGRVGRELAAGAGDPGTRALSARLTSEIARDRRRFAGSTCGTPRPRGPPPVVPAKVLFFSFSNSIFPLDSLFGARL